MKAAASGGVVEIEFAAAPRGTHTAEGSCFRTRDA